MILCSHQSQPRHASLSPDQLPQGPGRLPLPHPEAWLLGTGAGEPPAGKAGTAPSPPRHTQAGESLPALAQRQPRCQAPPQPPSLSRGQQCGSCTPAAQQPVPAGLRTSAAGRWEVRTGQGRGERRDSPAGEQRLTRDSPGRRLLGGGTPWPQRPASPRLLPALTVPRAVTSPGPARPGTALLTRGARPAPPSAPVAGCWRSRRLRPRQPCLEPGSRRCLCPARSDLVPEALLRRPFPSARHAHSPIEASIALSTSVPSAPWRRLSPAVPCWPPPPRPLLLGPEEWGRSLTILSSPPRHSGGVLLPRAAALSVKLEGSQWVTVKSCDGNW